MKQLVHLSLTEIGERIHKHLRRMEAAEEAEIAKLPREARNARRRVYFHASAGRSGTRVRVRYISYQHDTNLTRDEALHYLAALDGGFEGTHYALFNRDPPPETEQAEARFTALVRDSFDGFYLYEVTKRTETRVYGRRVGHGHSKDFLPRTAVVKVRATQTDLDAALAARAKYEQAKRDAAAEYAATIKALSPDRT